MGVEGCHSIEALSSYQVPTNKRRRQGKGAVCGNNSHRSPSSGRGCGQHSAKAKASRVLLESEVGGSGDVLP
jgi:hypothetical protein